MNSSFVKDVVWLDSEEFAGRISVDQASGKVSFISGPPELEEAVRESLSEGPHRLTTIKMDDESYGCTSTITRPDDPMFEVDLGGVLAMSGFGLPI